MASGAVWGIDVGPMRAEGPALSPPSRNDKIIAEAFDYIEYPKILKSAPATEPGEWSATP